MESKIYVTERNGFAHCRRSWEFSRLLGLKPRRLSNALFAGNGIHAGLEAYYKAKMAKQDQFISPGYVHQAFRQWYQEEIQIPGYEEPEEEEARMQLVEDVLTNYTVWAPNLDVGLEILAVEEKLTRPIGNTGFVLEGKLDIIALESGINRLIIMDHKSTGVMTNPSWLDFDSQMTAYLWLLEDHPLTQQDNYGPPLHAVHNVIRRKIPRVPEVLKDGKRLSQSALIDTTYEVYLKAILDNGFDPADYVKMLDVLKVKGNTFLNRIIAHRSPQEMKSFEEQLIVEVNLIAQAIMFPNYRIPRFTKSCVMCDYRELCKCKQEKGNWEFLIKANYVIDPEHAIYPYGEGML